jgi:hypothetical protein
VTRAPAWLGPVGVGVAVLLLQLPIFDRWVSLMDEGHILQFADLVARGGELYRDATLIAFPGCFYLLAGLFEIFEPSVRLARWTVAVEFALLVALVYTLLRGWLATHFVWLGVGLLLLYRIWAFPHWQMYSYSTTALTLIAASLVTLLAAVASPDARPDRWRIPLAGLLAGLAVACKQDYGGAAVLAQNVVLFAAWRSAPGTSAAENRLGPRLAAFNGAGLLVGLAIALHYTSQGLLGEMLRQTLWNHLVGIATFEYSSLPPLLPVFGQVPEIRSTYGFAVYVPAILFSMDWPRVSASFLYQQTFLWDLAIRGLFYGPYVYAAAALARVVWRRRALYDADTRANALRELALASLAALLIFTLHKPKDWVHVAVMYWPLLVLLTVHLDALRRARPRAARALLLAGALPAALATLYTGTLAWQLHARHDTPLAGARAGVRVTAPEAGVIGDAIDYLVERTPEGSQVAVLPYFPLLNFLAERDAPHRSAYVLWPAEEVPGRQAQIATALEATLAPNLLYHFTQWIQFPRVDEFAPELFSYLVDHYTMDRVFTDDGWGYMMAGLAREAAHTAGTPLFADDLAGAALYVEAADASPRRLGDTERGEWLRREVWPFRPVLALRPRSGGYRSVVSKRLRVPAGARLETGIGVNPQRWFKFPPSWVRFAVRIEQEGRREEIFSRTLDPHRVGAERGWFDISLPLDAFTGREVKVELVTETERDNSEVFEMGGFSWPRIVVLGAGNGPVAGSTP